MNIEMNDKDGVEDALPEPSDEEAFDAAMAEIGMDDEAAPADDAAADASVDADEDESADEGEAPADDAAAPDASSDTSQDSDTPDDDWADAPEPLRKKWEEAQRDYDLRMRSANGRVAAQDRKIAELSRQLQELQSGSSQANDDASGDGDEANVSDALATLREDYPDLAGPLLDQLEKQAQKIASLSEGVGSYQQERTQHHIAAQRDALSQEHPDWQQVAADDRFNGWLQQQPLAIQEAMQRNYEHIIDAKEAALVVGKFKQDLGILNKTDDGRDIKQARVRQRQLAGGRDAGRTGPSTSTGIPKDDFDTAAAMVFADRR